MCILPRLTNGARKLIRPRKGSGNPVGVEATDGAGRRLAVSISAVAVAAAASRACLREGPTSWSLGQVLGDLIAALTPGEGGPPNPTETSEGDARRSDLPEGVAGNRPKTRDRWSMDVGTQATGGGDGATNSGNR